jgi:hypothetical protein
MRLKIPASQRRYQHAVVALDNGLPAWPSSLVGSHLIPLMTPFELELPGKKKPMSILPPVAAPKGLSVAEVSSIAAKLIASVEKVVVGKHEQVTLAVAVWLAEGHLLIEDVPGVAKTMLARAMALSAGCTFKRVQCTPDLQPSDVLGEPYVESSTGRTEFRFGPIFSQFVLVDEINRASPRTQAALLEAMGEAMVTEGIGVLPVAEALHGGGHAKSHRAGGDVSAARGAKGPLPDADESWLPVAGRREADGGAVSIASSH